MPLIAAGLNHVTAPVELREKVAIADSKLSNLLRDMASVQDIKETAILSTCNRTEIYVLQDSDRPDNFDSPLNHFLTTISGLPNNRFAGHTYCYRDDQAAEHLMRVSSGLDSMIIGENQILGQVKSSYQVARNGGYTAAVLNNLFQTALAVGKRVRSETLIGRGVFSIGAAAVELASRIFGDSLAGKTVLILGAGKMSELTAKHLQSSGAPAVLVTNRTYERAVTLAQQLGNGAKARRFDELSDALLNSDIVICSTAAPHPIVHPELIQKAMRARRNRPLFLVDIAVPRDVDPTVGQLDNVYLYNIDDLSAVVSRDQEKRHAEIAKAELIIKDGVRSFQNWRQSLDVAPTISAVNLRLSNLRTEEISRIRARLAHLPEKDLRVIEIAFQSITGKVAHQAISAIKQTVQTGDGYEQLQAIKSAFGVDQLEETNDNPVERPQAIGSMSDSITIHEGALS